MTRNPIRMLDEVDLPAPVVVGMVVVAAAVAKSGEAFWAIGGLIVFPVLFTVARLGLARLKNQRAAMTSAPAANGAEPSMLPTATMKSSGFVPAVLGRHPRAPAASRAPRRRAA